jgi:hypothetical protein
MLMAVDIVYQRRRLTALENSEAVWYNIPKCMIQIE